MEARARVLEAQAKVVAAQTAYVTAMATAQAQTHSQLLDARAKLIQAQAQLITAIANANKLNAEARQSLEQARSLYLDNDLKKVQHRYKKRALYLANRPKKARDAYSASQAVTSRSESAEITTRLVNSAKSNGSGGRRRPGLTEEQFDPESGQIRWPRLLRRAEFAEHRARFESLALQIRNGGRQARQEVKGAADSMHAALRSLIRQVPSGEYVQAKRFIRSLSAQLESGSFLQQKAIW
jgi:exopolysaccharide biosynthesis protein